MIKRAKVVALSLIIGSGVFAAATFVANSQPWGYVAPPALSSSNFQNNNVYAFAPWFEEDTFRGDLLALPVSTDGSVALLSPAWKAGTKLLGQNYLTGRNIATTDGAGTATPFLYGSLTGDQQLLVKSEELVNFVRGDRSKEGTSFRNRTGVLGDIVHSTPVYVGKPLAGYAFDDYLSFAESKASRQGLVLVGANDGMLHAFNADDGTEEYAYVPSMVMKNLKNLAEDPYRHYYYVDGFLTVEDAQWGNAWHSVLVGGLGAGGMGYFALDVTDPSAASNSDVADKILWEFHNGSDGGGNVGYSYSRPSIIRLKKDKSWAAAFGNGYLSADGKASLLVVDVASGKLLKELVVNGGDDNGLSSPTMIDADGDGHVDGAYAGDLNGNVWKFDLSSESPDSWKVDLSGWPLFTTTTGQAITTAPEVGRHPTGKGLMVYVGTGRLFGTDDGRDKTTQAIYGLWDNGSSVSLAKLLQQQLKAVQHASGTATRTATNNQPDWDAHSGWMTETEIASASSLDQGERVLQDLVLRDGRISFMSVNPTVGTGDNWFIQLDADTGGAPSKTIIDVNNDKLLSTDDNVDADGDGDVEDIATERVVGQYQDFGLASRPVIGSLGHSQDSALINHLSAITPFHIVDADDPGLLGGHFDLDTNSRIYDFNSGATDGHVHEWDDKYDETTINYMDLHGGNGSPLHEIDHGSLGVDRNDLFILTVANTELSPGGVLEFNGTSMAVRDYHDYLNRYLDGALVGSEKFPILKLNPPTATQAAAGVQQLTSLKLSFDAYAILSGDLIPTETDCMKKNKPGGNGEYRNGALLVQALDASDLSAGFTEDEDLVEYVGGSASIHSELGYATDGLFWESTVFWHWDDGCYGVDAGWDDAYEACFITKTKDCIGVSDESAEKAKKKKKGKKDKKGKDDPGDGGGDEDDEDDEDGGGGTGSGSSGSEDDSGHNVSNTTVGGSNDTGRLFWKELIPEE